MFAHGGLQSKLTYVWLSVDPAKRCTSCVSLHLAVLCYRAENVYLPKNLDAITLLSHAYLPLCFIQQQNSVELIEKEA